MIPRGGRYAMPIDGQKVPHLRVTSNKSHVVHVDLGQRCEWFGLSRELAITFAKALLEKAGAVKVEITWAKDIES